MRFSKRTEWNTDESVLARAHRLRAASGLPLAREAECGYYADHGVYAEPERVVLTTSTSEAYSFLFRLLCDPGDDVVVPRPGYPLFDFLAVLDDVHIKP